MSICCGNKKNPKQPQTPTKPQMPKDLGQKCSFQLIAEISRFGPVFNITRAALCF